MDAVISIFAANTDFPFLVTTLKRMMADMTDESKPPLANECKHRLAMDPSEAGDIDGILFDLFLLSNTEEELTTDHAHSILIAVAGLTALLKNRSEKDIEWGFLNAAAFLAGYVLVHPKAEELCQILSTVSKHWVLEIDWGTGLSSIVILDCLLRSGASLPPIEESVLSDKYEQDGLPNRPVRLMVSEEAIEEAQDFSERFCRLLTDKAMQARDTERRLSKHHEEVMRVSKQVKSIFASPPWVSS
jgi:hypothetical protein